MSTEGKFNWQYLIPVYGIYKMKKDGFWPKPVWIGVISTMCMIVILLVPNACGSQKSTEAVPVVAHKVGETVNTEKYAVTLTKVSAKKTVGGTFVFDERIGGKDAPEGSTYVVIEVKYKNITKEPISFSGVDIEIIDPNGTKYDSDFSATMSYTTSAKLNTKTLSKLNPGVTANDGKVFEVAQELWATKGWKAKIEADSEVVYDIK